MGFFDAFDKRFNVDIFGQPDENTGEVTAEPSKALNSTKSDGRPPGELSRPLLSRKFTGDRTAPDGHFELPKGLIGPNERSNGRTIQDRFIQRLAQESGQFVSDPSVPRVESGDHEGITFNDPKRFNRLINNDTSFLAFNPENFAEDWRAARALELTQEEFGFGKNASSIRGSRDPNTGQRLTVPAQDDFNSVEFQDAALDTFSFYFDQISNKGAKVGDLRAALGDTRETNPVFAKQIGANKGSSFTGTVTGQTKEGRGVTGKASLSAGNKKRRNTLLASGSGRERRGPVGSGGLGSKDETLLGA